MGNRQKVPLEHAEQVELFRWANEVAWAGFRLVDGGAKKPYMQELLEPVAELVWLHAIPNGGARGDSARSNAIRGSQLRAEGVKKGVADIFLPTPRKGYCGLYIELKRADHSLSRHDEAQKAFAEHVTKNGYLYVLCYGAEMAKNAIREYLR